ATELELASTESLSGIRTSFEAPVRSTLRRHWWAWILGGGAVVGFVAMLLWPRAVLDPDRVVVFPLAESGAAATDKPGQSVALLLGHALQHTAPLRWMDGWTLLGMEQRKSVTGLPTAVERKLARRAGARFFMDGAIVSGRDSVTVLLRLYDARGDSLVQQVSQAAPAAQASYSWPALGVLAQLLPSLVTPGRHLGEQVLAELAGHDPGPVANWLQGDRAYREGRFEPALEHYQRAVAQDSTLALAALSGAQAAGWLAEQEEAVRLARLALRHAGSLPPRFRDLAAAFESFGSGRADSAVARVTRALAADSLWADAWAIRGEIYLHLLPAAENLDSIAEASFARAAALDPSFAPPLNHLGELMLRRGDVEDAEPLIARLRRGTADSSLFAPLLLMRDCVRGGPDAPNWEAAVASDPSVVLTAARQLAAGGSHMACAERALRTLLEPTPGDSSYKWGALLALNDVLMASGQAALPRLLDSAVISMPDARRLYLVNAVAGQDKGGRGDSVAAAFSSMPPPMSAGRIWYLGQWATVRKDTAHLAQLSGHAAVLRDESAAASDSLLASVLDAHLTLLRGDTSAAIRALSSLSSAVPLDWLVWDPWAALAAERVLLAELLLAHGEPGPSAAVAEVLDGSQSLAFLPFLRRALVVRMRAMEQLGKKRDAALLKARLEALEANDARRAGSEPGRR
ncbi:MAG TPA: tetratricopeptide repeat protein, partial [Gemmatimonadales bacterium]|nr:tetratricopeptide repeat protein [Gemmatimonadales bacterium]